VSPESCRAVTIAPGVEGRSGCGVRLLGGIEIRLRLVACRQGLGRPLFPIRLLGLTANELVFE
jgi:hypothetical protein